MISLQFGEPQFRIETRAGRPYIFDGIRKRWLLLTSEEWVRQNIVAYFITEMQYPQPMLALEKTLLLNGLKKRFDILVYDSNHQPWLLVECKAPDVLLSDAVLQQALRYNITIPVPYIVITNGNASFAWQKEHGHLKNLDALPPWA